MLTTPAHQSPTGVVLSASRRTELLEWAQPGRLIIEDDYDAEYRYDRAPVGALQGVAPDRVVYLGSTSKTLAPGLRIGWMVVPAHLIDRVRTAKSLADTGSSVMDQIAFSQFLTSGGYDRHLRQMRRRYPARRARPADRPVASPSAGRGSGCGGRRAPDRAVPGRLPHRGADPPRRRVTDPTGAAGTVLRRSGDRAAGPDPRLCQPHRIPDRHGCGDPRRGAHGAWMRRDQPACLADFRSRQLVLHQSNQRLRVTRERTRGLPSQLGLLAERQLLLLFRH